MKLKTSAQHTLISIGTALISVPVLAHAEHYENKEQETETKTKETQSNTEEKSLNKEQEQPNSTENQSITTQNSKPEQSTTPQNQAIETPNQLKTEQKTESQEEQPVQPVTQNQTVTIAKIPTVGETLFGLIIVTPFLLYALKKRIHRYG